MKINPDAIASDLINAWINGNRTDTIDALNDDHPGLTAMFYVVALTEKRLKLADYESIQDQLASRRKDAGPKDCLVLESDFNASSDIIFAWNAGNQSDAIERLNTEHPAIVATVILMGITNKYLDVGDCNSICNLLMDRRKEIADAKDRWMVDEL